MGQVVYLRTENSSGVAASPARTGPDRAQPEGRQIVAHGASHGVGGGALGAPGRGRKITVRLPLTPRIWKLQGRFPWTAPNPWFGPLLGSTSQIAKPGLPFHATTRLNLIAVSPSAVVQFLLSMSDPVSRLSPVQPFRKRYAKNVILLLAMSIAVASLALAQQTALPVKVSANGRYFVDQNGRAVFWLGTTQWELFHGFTLEDAKTILEESRKNGFTFVQVKLMGRRRRHETQRLRPEGLDRRRSSHAQRGVFQECGCRDPDGSRQRPRHSAERLPSVLPQVHHRGQRAPLGQVAGPALQGRTQHRLDHDARGASRSLCRSFGNWPRVCARGTEAVTSSASNPIPHPTPPASSTPRAGWISTRCRHGTPSS